MMNSKFFGKSIQLLFGAALLVGITACQHTGSYDLPAEIIPEPAGTKTVTTFQMQATKAEQSKYMLPHSNWYGRSITLSPSGQEKIGWILGNIQTNPYDVIVETSGNHDLDNRRRDALINYFHLQGIDDSETFILISTNRFKSTRVAELEGS